MAEGYVYVLGNETYIENLYKVGMTTRTPEERALELSKLTGTPVPFEVVYARRLSNVAQSESWVHRKLRQYRYSSKREFFKCDLETIKSVVDNCDESRLFEDDKKSEIVMVRKDFPSKPMSDFWKEKYGDSEISPYFAYYEAECEAISKGVLDLDPDIKMKVERRSFSFVDPIKGDFFAIEPQKSKITVAPLHLKPSDIESMGVAYRDITGKKYRYGGLVRVDFVNHGDETIKNAIKLAEMSRNSDEVIETWSLLRRKPE